MNILIAGAGSIGRRHISNLKNLDRDLEITVVDPSKNCQEVIQSKFGLIVFPSLEAALDNGKYDVGLVCSPNHMHIPQAKVLAEAGCHLFVEKPLSLDLAEAFLAAYAGSASESLVDIEWIARYAAVEVMRRIIGLAQLPIPPTQGLRARLLKYSRKMLMGRSIEELWT